MTSIEHDAITVGGLRVDDEPRKEPMMLSTNTFQYQDATVEALQYDGSAERASIIAEEFGFVIVQQFPLSVVFSVPETLTFSPGEYYELDTREIALPAGSWVWLDRDAQTIGCEWDSYLREHFISQPTPSPASVSQGELFEACNVSGQEAR